MFRRHKVHSGFEQVVALIFPDPQRASVAFDQAGENADHPFRQRRVVAEIRHFAGHFQPFFPVIVLVVEKVLTDEYHQPGSDATRRQQSGQKYQGNSEEEYLKGLSPITAEGFYVVAAQCQKQEVGTGQKQGSCMEYRRAG